MNPQQPYQQQPGSPPPPPGYQQPPQQGYAPPPGYPQQPGYQPPMATSSRWGPSSLGMEAHVAAGLSYLSMFFLGPIIPLVFFFIEKQNRFIKFHAAQGILLNISAFLLFIVLGIVNTIVGVSVAAAGDNSTAAGAGLAVFGLLSCVYGLVALALIGLVIWGAVAGFTGKYTKLPLIGGIAEKWAGGPAVPLY